MVTCRTVEPQVLQSKLRWRSSVDWHTTLACFRRHGNRIRIQSRSDANFIVDMTSRSHQRLQRNNYRNSDNRQTAN